MSVRTPKRPSGHVYLVEGPRGPRWYAKYRLPNQKQVKKLLGPAWTEGGRAPEGYVTERHAKAMLDTILADARQQALVAVSKLDAIFADAAREWLRHAEFERGVRPSSLSDYTYCVEATLIPTFGHLELVEITTEMVDLWVSKLVTEGRVSRRTINKHVTMMHGIFQRARKVYGLPTNPIALVDRVPERYSGDYNVYSPEEVWALARATSSEMHSALFLTAAFTGLRMGELFALRWRDVDHENSMIVVRGSYYKDQLGAPKSGRIRSVPMVHDVAEALARLRRRERFTLDGDLIFTLDGTPLSSSGLRNHFRRARDRAGLRPLRFHDLRHTFGSVAINKASVTEVQSWLGHSHIQTTMRYLHAQTKREDAERLAGAFAASSRVGAGAPSSSLGRE